MEWWEGAILVVGGVWLIGRISRQSPNHPVNSVAQAVAVSQTQQNLTTMTNTSGSVAVVAGEPLTGGSEPIPVAITKRNIIAVQRPVTAQPVTSTLTRSGFVPQPITPGRLSRTGFNPKVVSL